MDERLFALERLEVASSIIVVVGAAYLSHIRTLEMLIFQRKYTKIDIQKLMKRLGIVIPSLAIGAAAVAGMVGLCSYLFQKFPYIMLGIFIIPILIFLFWLLTKGVRGALRYMKDCMWLRKYSVEMKYMRRTQLESNLRKLHFDRIKYKYLEQLLLENIELTGKWPEDIRPQYKDDRVNYTLAKLDCLKLDSCDYLF